MILHQSAYKKIPNFFAPFLLYLLQVMLGEKELREVILIAIGNPSSTAGYGGAH
jgi:uncharacterized membrane protein